jgi:hypothetical protein
VRISAVVLDLSSSGKKVAKSKHWLARPPEIPPVHIAIHRAGRKEVGVMGGEIDICDGSGMALEGVLDCSGI